MYSVYNNDNDRIIMYINNVNTKLDKYIQLKSFVLFRMNFCYLYIGNVYRSTGTYI